jgi:hypothetical protein
VLHGDVEGEVNPAPWRMVEARRLVLGGSAEKSRRARNARSGDQALRTLRAGSPVLPFFESFHSFLGVV